MRNIEKFERKNSLTVLKAGANFQRKCKFFGSSLNVLGRGI